MESLTSQFPNLVGSRTRLFVCPYKYFDNLLISYFCGTGKEGDTVETLRFEVFPESLITDGSTGLSRLFGE